MRTRAEQVAGIRELADWLEAHPEVPIPHELTGNDYSYVLIMTLSVDDPKATLAAIARALPGDVKKDADSSQFEIEGRVGGINVKAIAQRNEVCERVVVGTREITRTIPDPRVAVPEIEVTETIEDVKWVCTPLMDGATR